MNTLKNTEFEPLKRAESAKNAKKDDVPLGFTSTLSLDKDYLTTSGTFDAVKADPDTLVDVSRETTLRKGTYRELYRLFRFDGHSRFGSMARAVYQRCEIRFQHTANSYKKEFGSIVEHPHGWSKDKKHTHEGNIWLYLKNAIRAVRDVCRLIARLITIPFRAIARLSVSGENSAKSNRLGNCISGLLYIIAAAAVAFTVLQISQQTDKRQLVRVYLDENYVGTTTAVKDVENAKHIYESDLSAQYGIAVILPCKLRYEMTEAADEQKLLTPNDTAYFREYMESYLAEGFGLYVDNKLAAVCEVGQWMNETVDDYKKLLQNKYRQLYGQNISDSVIIGNAVTVISGKYPKSYFLTRNELRKLFHLSETGTDTDETPLSLTLNYADVRQTDNDEYFGGMPSATVEMSVNMIFEEENYEKAPFETEYIYDDTLYQGMRRMVRRGRNGEKRVCYRVTYNAGKIIAKEIIESETLSEPQNEIVRCGTRETDDELAIALPTGTFIYPYQGIITSYYGWRVLLGQSEFHKGLDIYGPYQSTIVAADGGEVIAAGYNDSYGNNVLIRHDEHTVTRYAHCDSIYVNVGDLIAQGEPIAAMGQTGFATGVHVHFEVIYDGATVDPLPLISQPMLPVSI